MKKNMQNRKKSNSTSKNKRGDIMKQNKPKKKNIDYKKKEYNLAKIRIFISVLFEIIERLFKK